MKLKKLTKKQKADIYDKMEWEGGLMAAVEHGFIFGAVKGTKFEPLFNEFQSIVQKIEDEIEADGWAEAAELDSDGE